jgi:hypothetical protein
MPDLFNCPRIYLVRYGYITTLTEIICRQDVSYFNTKLHRRNVIPRLIVKMIGSVLISS